MKVAVEFLMSRGFRDDEIAVQLSRFYYVDIDELNHVVASIPRGSPPLGLIWKSVA